MSDSLLFNYRDENSQTGVTRASLKAWAANLGLTETAAIHMALAHVVLGEVLCDGNGNPIEDSPEIDDDELDSIQEMSNEELAGFEPGSSDGLFPGADDED